MVIVYIINTRASSNFIGRKLVNKTVASRTNIRMAVITMARFTPPIQPRILATTTYSLSYWSQFKFPPYSNTVRSYPFRVTHLPSVYSSDNYICFIGNFCSPVLFTFLKWKKQTGHKQRCKSRKTRGQREKRAVRESRVFSRRTLPPPGATTAANGEEKMAAS